MNTHNVTNELFEAAGIHTEAGWHGAFTRRAAHGAIPNGTPVVKRDSEPEDSHPNGTQGTILGSLSHPDFMGGLVMYFVEWAPSPRNAVACSSLKLQPIDGGGHVSEPRH